MMSKCAHCGEDSCAACGKQSLAPLSFRDQCAVAFLSSVAGRNYHGDPPDPAVVANSAFNFADAMATERKKRGPA